MEMSDTKPQVLHTAALVGLGGVGAFVASPLRDTLGEGFCVVAGGERRERLRGGVVINGVRENFPLRAPEEGAPVDLLIFATKNMQLPQAMEDASAFAGARTILLSLLNGIDSEEKLRERFPQAHTLRALIRVPAVHTRSGITIHQDRGVILFGEDRNETLSPQAAAVEDLFRRAGVACRVPEDMVRAQWLKFMTNVSENLTAALLGFSYGDFQRCEDARALCTRISREVIAVAQAQGVELREEDNQARERVLMTLPPDGRASTLQDLEAGRKTEIDTFAGRMTQLGRQWGVATPLCEFLYHAIRALEAKGSLSSPANRENRTPERL